MSSYWSNKVLTNKILNCLVWKLYFFFRPVKIIRLIAKHTCDEIIQTRSFRKLLLSQQVMGSKDDGLYLKKFLSVG